MEITDKLEDSKLIDFNIDEDSYRNKYDCDSYSKLKAFKDHPKSYKFFSRDKDFKYFNEGMLLGDAIDDLFSYGELTKFVSFEMKLPRPQVLKAIEYVGYNNYKKEFSFLNEEFFLDFKGYTDKAFLDAYDELGVKGKTASSFISECLGTNLRAFLESHKIGLKEKYFLTKSQEEIVRGVYSNLISSDYINSDSKKQFGIHFKYKGKELKSLLDILYVDEASKTLYPGDLKFCGEGVESFPKSFYKYGYYIQAALYTIAVTLLTVEEGPYKGFKVAPFEFIVFDSYKNVKRYKVSEQDIIKSIEGGETSFGHYFEGIDKILEDIDWHKEKKMWDFKRSYYEENEYETLNLFK